MKMQIFIMLALAGCLASAAAAAPTPFITLATLAPTSGKALVTNKQGSSNKLCLEYYKNAGSGSVNRLGVYPCTASSPLWVYHQKTQALEMKGTNGCLTDYGSWASGTNTPGAPVIMQCSASGVVTSQQWQLTPQGLLRSKSGLCLGQALATQGNGVTWLVNVKCGSAGELVWRNA